MSDFEKQLDFLQAGWISAWASLCLSSSTEPVAHLSPALVAGVDKLLSSFVNGSCFNFRFKWEWRGTEYFFKTSRNMEVYWWPKKTFIYSNSDVLNRLKGFSKIIMLPYLNENYCSIFWYIDILVPSVYMELGHNCWDLRRVVA